MRKIENKSMKECRGLAPTFFYFDVAGKTEITACRPFSQGLIFSHSVEFSVFKRRQPDYLAEDAVEEGGV